jgi:hypothetical protein
MTDINEPVAVALPSQQQEDKKLQKCDWKECKTNHENNISYPSGGILTRSSGFSAQWVSAGLEPWQKYGPGKNSQATISDYRADAPGAAYVATAAALVFPAYHTQKHHLVSINLFSGVPKLSHNAKLVDYDVNSSPNGVCLPSFIVDIVQHDLQCHRGKHPNALYNDKVRPLLAELEVQCVKYCHSDLNGTGDRQERLVADLNRLSMRTERMIRSWKWLLRSDAISERKQSSARYASLKKQ